MVKDVLFVGNWMEADLMREPLRQAGITLHPASTVKEAEDFLRGQEPGRMNLAVMVQPNLALLNHDDIKMPVVEDTLKYFDGVDTFDPGEVFVQHARASGLLHHNVPVYLTSYDKPDRLPEVFSGFLELTDCREYYRNLVDLLKHPRRQRGGERSDRAR